MKKQSQKALLIGGAVVVVALIVYFAAISPWPAERQATGTIGGVEKAEKYQADQLSEENVKLSDSELQDLLQNDEFTRLISDKNAMDFLRSLDAKQLDALKALDAQRTLFEVKAQYIEAFSAYHEARLNVMRMTGRIDRFSTF